MVATGNMLIMTWWLGPHIYGLFVTAISLVAFLASVSRAGVDTFLVRHETAPEQAMYATANAVVLTASLALIALAALLTPLLIRWYGNHEFVLPYLVLLVTIPVSGLTGVPMAKLERELNFRKIAAIELSGQSLGLLAAALLAFAKAGIWAPVGGQMVWQLVTLLATAKSAGLRVGVRLHREHWRPMCSFGLGMTLSLRTWQLRTLVNPLLVGKFAGTEAVAFVALAIRIAEALGTFRLAAGRIAIAALARLQGQRENFRSALEGALFLQVIILGPLLCVFALAGPFLLRHALGAKWLPSLAVYPFIAVGVLVNSIYNLQASALFVLEQHWTVLRCYAAHVFLLSAGASLLIPHWGIVGYGLAELVACCPYYAIHRGVSGSVHISCRKSAVFAAGFGAILFLPLILSLRS
jgi:O-antigen/teichoic acid export membrane protein